VFAIIAASAALASPSANAVPEPQFFTHYAFVKLEPSGYGPWLSKWNDWFKVDQLPATVRDQAGKGKAAFQLSIDDHGALTRCDPVGSDGREAVAKVLCDRMMEHQTFPITYTAPGRAVAAEWSVLFDWETQSRAEREQRLAKMRALGPPPPAPPPPVVKNDAWPPRHPPYAVIVSYLPDIAKFATAALRGTVGVYARAVPEREEPDCIVALGSGDPSVDNAACNYVRAMRLEYKQPCFNCTIRVAYPLLLRFDGKKSKVRLPREDLPGKLFTRVNNLKFRADELALLRQVKATTPVLRFGGHVSLDGVVTDCRVLEPTNNADLDAALCAIMRHQKFELELDAFGDPQSGEFLVPIDISQL